MTGGRLGDGSLGQQRIVPNALVIESPEVAHLAVEPVALPLRVRRPPNQRFQSLTHRSKKRDLTWRNRGCEQNRMPHEAGLDAPQST
eukprot:s474_g5.t1